jgi:hypothetical protein
MPLKLGPLSSALAPNAMFSKQTIHANPSWPVFPGRHIPQQTAPWVTQQPIFPAQQIGPDRVEMNVITRGLEIPVAAPIHHHCLISSAKDVPSLLMSAVKPDGIAAQKPMHSIHEIPVGCLYNQVKMVAHQAVSVHLPVALLARFGQCLEKLLPIHIIEVYVVPPISTTHDVVNGTRIFNS